MAFYAELKRRRWYCICEENQITIYSNYLYDQWYNSLTDEQKNLLEEARKRKQEQREKEVLEALSRIGMITNVISRYTNGYYMDSRSNGRSMINDLLSIIKEDKL